MMDDQDDLRDMVVGGEKAEEDLEVTQFYVNPISKPIPQGRSQAALQDTICELNMQRAVRNGPEVNALEVPTRTVAEGSAQWSMVQNHFFLDTP